MSDINQISLAVEPYFAVVGIATDIKVSGLNPGQHITIKLNGIDDKRHLWSSYAQFIADENGNVDIHQSPALSGSYKGLDGAGLFWSMKQNDGISFDGSVPMLENMQVTVYDKDMPRVTKTLKRIYFHPSIGRYIVREDGVVGEYFAPKESVLPKPAVIVIGGAEGGAKSKYAALLSYYLDAPVLALAYFQKKGLPKSLSGIAVETVERAISWLNKRAEVKNDEVGVVAFSRGSELAFFSASVFPQIKAVVAYIPSIVLFEGLGAKWWQPSAAWTYRGKELPFLPFRRSIGNMLSFLLHKALNKNFSTRKLFLDSLSHYKDLLESATVKVEEAHADIMFISGKNDMIWPADLFGEMLMERLVERNYRYRYIHLSYENAGHFITYPYCSMMKDTVFLKTAGLYENLGGTPQGNAFASIDSWAKMLDFLKNGLYCQ